nr:MAG TPA: hypothetical protein [Bacteriophage sp.]
MAVLVLQLKCLISQLYQESSKNVLQSLRFHLQI